MINLIREWNNTKLGWLEGFFFFISLLGFFNLIAFIFKVPTYLMAIPMGIFVIVSLSVHFYDKFKEKKK